VITRKENPKGKDMAKIITVPNIDDPVMNADRTRISLWAPTNGWIYAPYNDPSDHVTQINDAAAGNAIETLDLDGHGSPQSFSGMGPSDIEAFGRSLRTVTGFSANSIIYLDGCNTGLTDAVCISQVLADAVGCSVYGSKGYLTGTYAEGTAHCYPTLDGGAPYPGSVEAQGDAVWNRLAPAAFERRRTMTGSITIRTQHHLSVEESNLIELLERVIAGPTVEFPQLRMAPDGTINYLRHNREAAIFDLYGNGAFIRNRITGDTFRVDTPDKLKVKFRSVLDSKNA
jgi:hypothetical protein